ncbi:MAG: U32 family peptidase [Peptococcaceae bacterium]|nr:U32 family peptidase [Peptococcaceae bacterium]
MSELELLAPAGNLEKLKFAFHYGADAVYCAGKAFGLRAFAGNFSEEELREAVAYAHSLSKKIYVTLNMYPHNEDLAGLDEYLDFLEEIQPDALLVADPGIYDLIQEKGVTIPIHISTQATVVNWAGVRFWQKQKNVERVVLARELSLEEIQTIADKTDTELEIFVHGAMCMSYSGRCLMSNYMTGRDANRGECAQPCRWNYALVEEKRPGVYYPIEQDAHGSYIFNSFDLCTLERLPALLREQSVQSLKIEGRMKSLYYVSTVIRCYRAVIDAVTAHGGVAEEEMTYWLDELEKVSHRPYTTGFLFGRPEDNAVNHASGGYIKPYDFVGIVKDYDAETGIVTIEQRNKIAVGDTIQFFGRTYREYDHQISAMTDEDGLAIDAAPHAQQIIHMPLPFAVEPMDLIRKKID